MKRLSKRQIGIVSLLAAGFFLAAIFLAALFNPLRFRFNVEIERACEKYGVKKEIVLAVIRAESNFRDRAISRAGAVGLMQIMPDTARFIAEKIGYGDYDLFCAADNVELGAAYLGYLFGEFNSENAVFAAYNAGEGVVKQWLDDPEFSFGGADLYYIPYPETRKYVERVNFYKRIYVLLDNLL